MEIINKGFIRWSGKRALFLRLSPQTLSQFPDPEKREVFKM